MEEMIARQGSKFGNGRAVRNLFEACIEQQAIRMGLDARAEIDLNLREDVLAVEIDQ